MTHVTCRLTAKNRDRLRNPTLGNRIWAPFRMTMPTMNENTYCVPLIHFRPTALCKSVVTDGIKSLQWDDTAAASNLPSSELFSLVSSTTTTIFCKLFTSSCSISTSSFSRCRNTASIHLHPSNDKQSASSRTTCATELRLYWHPELNLSQTSVVGCWCGYLSGARCRLAYGPADATATHCFSKIQIGFTFLVPAHLGSPRKRAH